MQSPRVIEVSSPSAHERGVQYGSAAADLIARAIDYYRAGFAHQAGLGWDQVLDHIQPWQLLIERDFPEILDELAGVAAGAGVRLADILALNCRGEIIYDNWFHEATDGVRRSHSPTTPRETATSTPARTGTGATRSATPSSYCGSCSRPSPR